MFLYILYISVYCKHLGFFSKEIGIECVLLMCLVFCNWDLAFLLDKLITEKGFSSLFLIFSFNCYVIDLFLIIKGRQEKSLHVTKLVDPFQLEKSGSSASFLLPVY